MAIWLKVTKDKYEFPVAIGNSAADLARKIGQHPNTIISTYYKWTHGVLKTCPYRKVEEEDLED